MRIEPSDIKEPKTIRPQRFDPDCEMCHRGRIVCNACWAGAEQAMGCTCQHCQCATRDIACNPPKGNER